MTGSAGDPSVDKRVWDKTLAEKERGWLVGPLRWDSLAADAVVSRRFARVQGEKIRPSDDYSQSQVNDANFSEETASVDNVDFICAMLCRLMNRLAFYWRIDNRTFTGLVVSVQAVDHSGRIPAVFLHLCVFAAAKRSCSGR